MKVTAIINALGIIPKRFGKGIRRLSTSRDHPDYSIIKIGQNTEKSRGDLQLLKLQ